MARLDITAERHRLLKLAEEAALDGRTNEASTLLAISREVSELPTEWDGDRQVISLPDSEE